jgi:hypothetical protein
MDTYTYLADGIKAAVVGDENKKFNYEKFV